MTRNSTMCKDTAHINRVQSIMSRFCASHSKHDMHRTHVFDSKVIADS
jgi:hypothetical protein